PAAASVVYARASCGATAVVAEFLAVDLPAVQLRQDLPVVVDLDRRAANAERLVADLVAVGVVQDRLDRHGRIVGWRTRSCSRSRTTSTARTRTWSGCAPWWRTPATRPMARSRRRRWTRG